MASAAATTEVDNPLPQPEGNAAGQGSSVNKPVWSKEVAKKFNNGYKKAQDALLGHATRFAKRYPTGNLVMVVHPPKSNKFAAICGGNIGKNTVVCGRVTAAVKHVFMEYNLNPNMSVQNLILNKGGPLTPLEETLRAGEASGLLGSKQVAALLELSAKLGMSQFNFDRMIYLVV